MRTCPECEVELRATVSRGVEVDLCAECGGIFLDRGEFDSLVAERFRGGPVEKWLDETALAPANCRSCGIAAPEGAGCPECGAPIVLDCPVDGAPMYVVEFEDLEVDKCPDCGGLWIDPRDRLALRRRDASETDDVGTPAEEIVECSGCGATTQRRVCIRRMDVYWCESCVVEGNYPGGHGPPVGRRLKEAAKAMAEERARLDQRKERARQIKASRNTVSRHQGRQMHGTGLVPAVADAIETTARSLRSLFGKKPR